ncbi:unnamed protein product [Caenorhabditis brenneri]
MVVCRSPPTVSAKPSIEDDVDVAVIEEESLHTPKSHLKKPRFQSEESSRKRVTSTPKTAERTLKFPDEITPIRPTDQNTSFSSNHVNLSAIEEEKTLEDNKKEEEEEEQNDSFDVFRVTPDSTKTITNTSYLLKQAEEHSSVVEPTNYVMEHERLERMMPTEEEPENMSVDSFDDFKTNDNEELKNQSIGTPKNAVFSNKMSSFAFDDDDSFDDPIVDVPVAPVAPKKTPKASSSTKEKSKETPTPKASTSKQSKTLQLDHDSFDEFDFDI